MIDLSDAAETDLVAADEDLGLRGAITPVPGGGTVRVGAPTDESGIPIGHDRRSRWPPTVPPTC